ARTLCTMEPKPCMTSFRAPSARYARRGSRQQRFSQLTIQDTPNLSTSMPNDSEKKVLPSGMSAWPPLDNALNTRSASSGLATDSATLKPLGAWKGSGDIQSLAMSRLFSNAMQAWMILSAGGGPPAQPPSESSMAASAGASALVIMALISVPRQAA